MDSQAFARIRTFSNEAPASPKARVLADNETYATLINTGPDVPACTLSRPYLGKGLFRLAATDGTEFAAFPGNPTWQQVKDAARAYVRAGAGLESMTPEELKAEQADAMAREVNNRNFSAGADLATFQASGLCRAYRAARRAQLARELLAEGPKADPAEGLTLITEFVRYAAPVAIGGGIAESGMAEVESGPVGPDWQGMGKDSAFYAQAREQGGRPGPFAFGPTEQAARDALARKAAPVAAPEARSHIATLSAMLAARRAARKAHDAARVAYREGNPGQGRQHQKAARAADIEAGRLAADLAAPINAALAAQFALRVKPVTEAPEGPHVALMAESVRLHGDIAGACDRLAALSRTMR